MVVVLSSIFQLIAAILALRLITITEKRLAWTLISISLFLMFLRRAISLFFLLAENQTMVMNPLQEYFGVVLSLFMLLGIALIGPIFAERKLAEEKLFRLATHDSLTGLANRFVLDDALHRAVAIARRDSKSVLIFMDADRFKDVNDHLGHMAGDKVLKNVAERIKASLRAEDILARVGGDEFAILMEDSTIEDGWATIERVKKAVCEEKVPLDGGEKSMTCSYGMVLIDGELEPDLLLSQADSSMYENKKTSK